MGEKSNRSRSTGRSSFPARVDAKATRKIQARRRGAQSVWIGFGMMGLVGWSIALPTLGGAILGIWLDKNYPGEHPWTLALLVLGLAIGCTMAWYWISREHKAIHREEHKHDDE